MSVRCENLQSNHPRYEQLKARKTYIKYSAHLTAPKVDNASGERSCPGKKSY